MRYEGFFCIIEYEKIIMITLFLDNDKETFSDFNSYFIDLLSFHRCVDFIVQNNNIYRLTTVASFLELSHPDFKID